MATFEIPLIPEAQTFQISLVGTAYSIRVCWNTYSNLWVVDIALADGTPLVSGIPLVTGSDLLEQYDYLNFGGSLIAETDGAPLEPPTYGNLGLTGKVYFITT